MGTPITVYQDLLNLQSASFCHIDHEDAMVAIVYKVTLPSSQELILKICDRTNDYLREVYFLKCLAGRVPVPRIIETMQPETGIHGAILMECLPGALLKTTDFTEPLTYELGSLLARIHLNRASGYGDLIQPHDLSSDCRASFTAKFDEGFSECADHLPQVILERCRHYYDRHINLLASVDGPCIVHRDFRPGNVLIYEGKLQGIIDWASGRASFAEEDFCSMEHDEWQISPTYKKSFFNGYASIRPVPDYKVIMPLLRLNKAIATIGFTVKRNTLNSSHARIYKHNRQFLETLLIP